MFAWSDELRELRSGVAAVLDAVVDSSSMWERASVAYSAESSRRVCTKLAEAGLLVPHWPTEWGGRGWSPWHQIVIAEEMWRRGEPRAPQYLNINFIGPALTRFGTDEQRATLLPPMASGRALWCQGFSEADAGSDLTRLRTTATRVDGGYVVEGAKLWISYADVAEHCFLLARLKADETGDGAGPRIVLLVPMDSEGIRVSEIQSLPGPHTFHEVQFDDVFVPSSALLGSEHNGWSVVVQALVDERVGAPEYVNAEVAVDRVLDAAQHADTELSSECRARIGHAFTRCHAARMLTYAAVADRAAGADRPVTAFQARAAGRIARQAAADAISLALVEIGDLDDPATDVEPLNAVLAGVAGGAYEVLLDLVASELTGVRSR